MSPPQPDDDETETTPETTQVTVEVTEDDIQEGLRGDSENCPTARALCRDLPVSRAEVTRERIRLVPETPNDDGYFDLWRLQTPMEVAHWVNAFDSGEAVDPLEVELEIPEDLAPEGAA